MGAFAQRRSALTDLRFSAALPTALGVTLVAAGAYAGVRLIGPAPHLLEQALAVFCVVALIVHVSLPHHLPHRRFGPANTVTLVRAVLVALIAGLVGHAEVLADRGLADWGLADRGWAITAAAALALALDGADGWLARRCGTASRFGARFDMELDALFLVVLSALVFELGKAGAWVLLSGALRYLFVAAGILLPALRHPLPPSFRRKAVCALQIGALVACLAPPVDGAASVLLAATALTLLTISFAMDAAWLLRRASLEGG